MGEEFYRAPDGTFSVFEKDGLPLDGIAQGINVHGASVGDYVDARGKTVGYVGETGTYTGDFKLHLHGKGKFLQISPRAIDDLKHNTAGFFVDQNGSQHAFLQNRLTGVASQIDHPRSKATTFEDFGAGQWIDANGDIHAFLYMLKEHKGPFFDLDPQDGSTSQQAWGANQDGLVALSTDIGMAYIYCPRHHPEKCPGGGFAIKKKARQPVTAKTAAAVP